jgi:peptidoglycan hydrolase-like protein with peptidoglycan-binding domain
MSEPAAAGAPTPAATPRPPIIPDYITVHLGTPNANARNIRVPFPEYVKNVASSEIYPTWPASSLEANITSIITFALNRIYTEWYRSRGFPFDITNSTAFDMAYVENREIFNSISTIVDRVFDRYVRRAGRLEPYFTQFCNGTTATCPGLSQWGTVTLANRGMTPLQILHHYYPNDLEYVTGPIAGITQSYPGYPLRQGNNDDNVRLMQRFLNRIRTDYPLIPQITNPNGLFGPDTTAAVQTFQRIFNMIPDGVIGNATWNRIWYIYVAVTRLAELNSEGEFIGIGLRPPTSVLRQGSRGSDVSQLQFLLEFISQFFPSMPWVIRDAVFGASTKTAVEAFQRQFGLTPDGIVGPNTWNKLYEVFRSINNNVELPRPPVVVTPPYPGTPLRVGSSGSSVRTVQEYLNAVSITYPSIPKLTVDGIFGPRTQTSVIAFQRLFGLAPDGVVGPLTWNKLMSVYRETHS